MTLERYAKIHEVALVADDYGLAPGIGVAIRDLLERGRLSGTGAMANSRHWPAEAHLLRGVPGAGTAWEAGIHLVLTDLAPLGPMPGLAPGGRLPGLGRLLGLALARRLDRAEVAAELERQLDAFEAAWGAPPAFLDGHHHVHQLPVVRDAVADLWTRRLRHHETRVRYCTAPPSFILGAGVAVRRAMIIAGLGLAWRRLGRRAGMVGNRAFAGVRDFAGEPPYATLMGRWLERTSPGTLIMCHPGLVDDALRAADGLAAPREEEYRFLAGDEFAALLGDLGIALVRPSGL